MNVSPVFTSTKKTARWLTKNKQGTFAALLSSAILLAFNVQAEQKNFDDMHKQLDIMNNIIQSAIKSESTNKRAKKSSVNSIYLHGQGVVFTLKSHHSNLFNIPSAPTPPHMSSDTNFAFKLQDEDFVVEFESDEPDYEHAMEIFEQQREHSRELRSEQRDLAYELRDIARESKYAKYQLRHVEEKEKQALKAELKKLEVKRVSLEKDKAQLDKKAKKSQVKRAEQKALKAQQRIQHFDKLTTTVADTICMYGNGLKAIPKDEHVSVIIKLAGDKAGRHYQDKVFVFTKKDINSCANDKITSKKLLVKANKYQF